MNREQILDTILMLSRSQGFYGRLYRDIMDADEEDRECFLDELEAQNFGNELDLIYYFEC